MASYVEVLAEDRTRLRTALEALIEHQIQAIQELEETLVGHKRVLDQYILRTFIFRNAFGTTQETLDAETDTEEASKPVTEIMRQHERESRILATYRKALAQIEGGIDLESLGKMPVGELSE
jgi:hypothetical protein